MKVEEPGYTYKLDNIDGEVENTLTFVNKGLDGQPKHPGTLCQDAIRVVI